MASEEGKRARVQRRRRRRRPIKQRYVTSLDGLRALCALGVIGYHMRLPWMGGGLLGVTILFVLSGYLVTAGLIREFGKSHGKIDLLGFWTRRFWRLMPTVFVVTAVTGVQHGRSFDRRVQPFRNQKVV